MNADRELIPFGRPSTKRLDSEDTGRTCAEDGCDTVLSRYNKTNRCGVHEATRDAPPTRKSK
jgi:hypothetical protein